MKDSERHERMVRARTSGARLRNCNGQITFVDVGLGRIHNRPHGQCPAKAGVASRRRTSGPGTWVWIGFALLGGCQVRHLVPRVSLAGTLAWRNRDAGSGMRARLAVYLRLAGALDRPATLPPQARAHLYDGIQQAIAEACARHGLCVLERAERTHSKTRAGEQP